MGAEVELVGLKAVVSGESVEGLGLGIETGQAIVCAEDVTHGKPNPEVFLTGAARLDIEPANCAVFEDAYAGLQAAKAGGMKAIGLATTHPASALEPCCKNTASTHWSICPGSGRI